MNRLVLHVLLPLLMTWGAQPQTLKEECRLDPTNRDWMCDDCIHVQACREIYGIVGFETCNPLDLNRFNTMYELLLQRVPVDDVGRYNFTGNASCTLGATIAMSLNGLYGAVCASNENPQVNAARTNIFCMCKDSYCDVEYTDTVLNILLICIILLLTVYLIMGSAYMCRRPINDNSSQNIEPSDQSTSTLTSTSAGQKHWTRMKIRTNA